MNYKKIIPAIILLFLFEIQIGYAQKTGHFNPYMIYDVAYSGKFMSSPIIYIKPDSNTTAIYPMNFVNGTGITSTNIVYLEGTKKMDIFTRIGLDNLKDYRYRVILDDTIEIVHWKAPDPKPVFNHFNPMPDSIRKRFINKLKQGKKPDFPKDYYKYGIGIRRLALLNSKNKKITVQMYNINYPQRLSTVYIYNKTIPKPEILLLANTTHYKDSTGSPTWEYDYISLNKKYSENAIPIDSIRSIWPVVYRNDANMLYQIYVKNLSKSNARPLKVPTQWVNLNGMKQHNHNLSYSIIPNYVFKDPGKYQITVVPQLPGEDSAKLFKDKATSITFEVLPPIQKTFTLRQITPFAGGMALLLGIGFWQYKTHQNKKLSKEIRQKEITKTQLVSIRSQLNPHFMYNALAGIQNLMNKNETEKASEYLGKFSRLTRNVLEESANNLISIANEEMLLDDYLQMEQLRFGFQYAIDIDKNINKENTEIPAMLLQPFAENAVKHGIAGLKSKGNIHICFSQNKENISVQIKDNGTGFDTGKKQDGFGLKLSQKRIALLNEIYKEAHITLKIQSGKMERLFLSTCATGYNYDCHNH